MTQWLSRLFQPLLVTVAAFALVRIIHAPPFAIALQPLVTDGLVKPVYLTHAGDGSGRLFVVELEGRVRVIRDGRLSPTPYLDISARVTCCQEQGLFSVAFDPDYASNGTLYLSYTDLEWDTVVERVVAAEPEADVADPISVTAVLVIEQPYFNHNGGQLQFGPDGYLYVGVGDGGGIGDPENRGQAHDTLLGKLLRIDVRGVPTYTIPPSNPFVGIPGTRSEIWDVGLRNPWRFSFDRATGDLYIGDVGVACHEEINFEPAGSGGGLNYGWRRMEGLHAFNRDESALCIQPKITPPGLTLPIATYGRHLGNAVIGGHVYRGRAYPWLDGVYFYADFGSGRIWALQRTGSNAWSSTEMLDTPYTLSSFGEDERGELYVVSFGDGQIFRLTSSPPN